MITFVTFNNSKQCNEAEIKKLYRLKCIHFCNKTGFLFYYNFFIIKLHWLYTNHVATFYYRLNKETFNINVVLIMIFFIA